MGYTENLIERKDIRRILIMKWSAMGDVVIATALMEDIRRAFPDATIDINTLPPWDRLFDVDPRFRRVIAADLRRRGRQLREALRWLGTVRSGRYDLIVDLQSNDRSRLLLSLLRLLPGAPRHLMGNHRRWPYTIAPEAPEGVIHAFEHQQRTLQAGGIPTLTPRPQLHIAEQFRRQAQERMAELDLRPGRYAIFLPGCQAAGWLKRWGAARYGELARRLHAGIVEHVVLIGASAEEEELAAIERAVDADWLINLCGRTAIQEIVPLCEGARCIIANDTGTAHVAACTSTPMVAICGPTDPRRVRPVGPNVRALQATLPCINCYRKTCDHHSCMEAITPEMVQAALIELLSEAPT